MKTLGSTLDRYEGFGAGFDFVRIALAMSILAFHSVVVAGDLDGLYHSPGWIIPNLLVPMFFAVSGFLITGSALRLKLRDFLINRGLRIVPALAVEIVASALILGPIFTVVPLVAYFTDPDFYQYFGNILGLIQYDLPGVFLSNKSAGVINQSLWTVPYEILCYIAMSALVVTGLLKKPMMLAVLTAAYILTGVILQFTLSDPAPGLAGKAISSLFFGRGSLSFECFLAGSLVYLYRFRIPHSAIMAAAVPVLVIVLALLGDKSWSATGVLNLVLCPVLTYFILSIGLSPIPKVPLYNRGDYSYGVYLYGYPVQQALVAALGPQSPVLNFFVSLALVTTFAAFSWHTIEKPILKLRKKFSFVGRRLDEHMPTTPTSPEAATPGG